LIVTTNELTKPLASLSEVYCYPNPTIKGWIRFTSTAPGGLPVNTKVKIFNIAGELIFEDIDKDGGDYKWECVNKVGKKVSSGIYIYVISDEKTTKTGKLGIIR
jgi:hypothetical protein